jgi:hypothetical protein
METRKGRSGNRDTRLRRRRRRKMMMRRRKRRYKETLMMTHQNRERRSPRKETRGSQQWETRLIRLPLWLQAQFLVRCLVWPHLRCLL